MAEKIINMEKMEQIINIFGNIDENINIIEKLLSVSLVNRGNEIKVNGKESDVLRAAKVIEMLATLSKKGEAINEQNIRYMISMLEEGEESKVSELGEGVLYVTSRGKPVRPKTLGQKKYVEAIRSKIISIGYGPAGTGKTYLAVAMAVSAFKNNEVNKIIITRPAVEAGEKLGFLPGDLQNKVDPYLRPLHDALYEMLGTESYQKYLERGNIEVAPLAYMRGRTLDDSFIILDEAQNTTCEQMKMFLTRLGFNSKAVITGDITQVDLPYGKKSGLKEATRILKDIDEIAICELKNKDVVRHSLVMKIIDAYDKYENVKPKSKEVK